MYYNMCVYEHATVVVWYIEVNPCPKGMKICPQCKNFVGIKQNICKCGFKLGIKGRPLGTTKGAGFKASKG